MTLTPDEAELYARAKTVNLQLPVVRLLRALERVVTPGARYVVGGGIAVAAHGYRRMTSDLDVFASPVTARRFAVALRAEGLTVERIADSHVIAYYPEDNPSALEQREIPEHRIDLLATITEPETTAIRTAQPTTYAGATFAVMPVDMLVAIKFMAGRPRDLADVGELVALGGVDIARARYLVAISESDRQAAAFVALARKARSVKENGHYLQRAGLNAAFAERRPFV